MQLVYLDLFLTLVTLISANNKIYDNMLFFFSNTYNKKHTLLFFISDIIPSVMLQLMLLEPSFFWWALVGCSRPLPSIGLIGGVWLESQHKYQTRFLIILLLGDGVLSMDNSRRRLSHFAVRDCSKGSLCIFMESMSGRMIGFSLGGREERDIRLPAAVVWTSSWSDEWYSWYWPMLVRRLRWYDSKS